MTRLWRRVGLRERLAFALAAVAVLSVAVATVLADAGLDSRLNQFARERLQTAATHTAELATGLYGAQGRWTPGVVTELGHLAEMNGYRLAVLDSNGQVLGPGSVPPLPRASHPITVGGQVVGTVTVAPVQGQVLTGEDRSLHARLNRLHLLAGGLALLLGLLAALLLAPAPARGA